MWNANVYEIFEKERMQPSVDLAARIADRDYKTIIDIGCGSGMSTVAIKHEFPEAEIIGVDLSENMLEKARKLISSVTWMKRDCSKPLDDLGKFDLAFSNAFLQWIENQEELVKNIRELLCDNGTFAIQIPDFEGMPVSDIIKEAAAEFDSDRTLFSDSKPTCFNYSLPVYYDMFCRYFSDVEIWQTNYVHQMKDSRAIIDFLKGTALLPYLDCLDEFQSEQFLNILNDKIRKIYKASENGTVLFEFKRIFAIAKNTNRKRDDSNNMI